MNIGQTGSMQHYHKLPTHRLTFQLICLFLTGHSFSGMQRAFCEGRRRLQLCCERPVSGCILLQLCS